MFTMDGSYEICGACGWEVKKDMNPASLFSRRSEEIAGTRNTSIKADGPEAKASIAEGFVLPINMPIHAMRFSAAQVYGGDNGRRIRLSHVPIWMEILDCNNYL